MTDEQIVQLYWNREQEAITATADKYGNYCATIARNILVDMQDTEECVNDTYLKAWNTMPPHKPSVLGSFLGKITRNLAIDRYRHAHAAKRNGGNAVESFEELEECLPNKTNPVEDEMAKRELVEALNQFLGELPITKRNLFVCRYWYFDSVSDIAGRFGMTENNVAVTLKRLRVKLHSFLVERGFEI